MNPHRRHHRRFAPVVARWVIRSGCVVSAVAFVAVVAAWLRSQHTEDLIRFNVYDALFSVDTSRGHLILWCSMRDDPRGSPPSITWSYVHQRNPFGLTFAFSPFKERYNVISVPGFTLRRVPGDPTGAHGWYDVIVAWPLLATATAAPPLLWTLLSGRRWHRARQRRRAGLCEHCGYDLRGSPERCPECGCAASPIAP
jgi:hypothetical protein